MCSTNSNASTSSNDAADLSGQNSPRAAADLHRIFTYISSDSPLNATRVLARLRDAIDTLEQFPHRSKVHQLRADPDKTVRCLLVYPHLVYYRVRDQTKVARVIEVRDGRRRQPRRFR